MFQNNLKRLLSACLSLGLLLIGSSAMAQFNPNVCFLNGETLDDGDSATVYEQFEVPFGTSCSAVEETFTCNQ